MAIMIGPTRQTSLFAQQPPFPSQEWNVCGVMAAADGERRVTDGGGGGGGQQGCCGGQWERDGVRGRMEGRRRGRSLAKEGAGSNVTAVILGVVSFVPPLLFFQLLKKAFFFGALPLIISALWPLPANKPLVCAPTLPLVPPLQLPLALSLYLRFPFFFLLRGNKRATQSQP